MREAVVVAVVRRRSKQDNVVSLRREMFDEFVALSALNGIFACGRFLCVGAAFVRFVHDEQIPSLLPDTLAHLVLLGVIHRSNDLVGTLPGIRELLLVNGGENDVERLAKPTEHFVLPLNRER